MTFTIIWPWWLICFLFNQNLSSENSKALVRYHCFMKGDRDTERVGGGGEREGGEEEEEERMGSKEAEKESDRKKEKENTHLRTKVFKAFFPPDFHPGILRQNWFYVYLTCAITRYSVFRRSLCLVEYSAVIVLKFLIILEQVPCIFVLHCSPSCLQVTKLIQISFFSPLPL